MSFDDIIDRAEEYRFETDLGAMSDKAKIGEGGNNSAFLSPRGYVVKPVMYDWKSKSPHDQEEIVDQMKPFPWVEVVEMDSDDSFKRAMIRMPINDITHEQAVEAFYLEDILRSDLRMFSTLRDEGVTYKDFKPDNIGYFWSGGMLEAKPIDIFDSYAWEQQQDLENRKFADIIDVYLSGTQDEAGIVDSYPISTIEAERVVMDYFDIEPDEHLEAEPYQDLMSSLDESFNF